MKLLGLIPPDYDEEFRLVFMLYFLHHLFTSNAFKTSYADTFCVKLLHKWPGFSNRVSHAKGIVSLERC